jgi:hypothetical protein
MKRRTHLRNGVVATLSTLLIFLLAYQQMPAAAAPLAQTDPIVWQTTSVTVSLQQGANANFTNTLRNNRGTVNTNTEVFEVDVIGLQGAAVPAGLSFTVTPDRRITVAQAGGTRQVSVIVSATSAVPAGSYTLLLRARLVENNTPVDTVQALATLTVNVTAVPTATPTVTGSPAPVCRDGFEDDNNPSSAKVIDVNTSQQRTICGSGDEDWLVFGGVAGKLYTVDISRMDPGIDLSLELFDSELRSIAFNDDFFNRDGANPNPADIRPRLTIRIPVDGPYYVRIRDNAGRGGVNYFYVVALLSESYGPTPTTVREICLDLFEPDGLPEQGRLITSNEIQEARRLCPTGDADWVTFFGKAGKRYIIFTDTRRYRGPNVVNGEAQAGADTVMVLADRDGVSLLDFNDDVPGGSTLDSQIEFTPDVDGFYFVQVKNTGDIGNQFIRYDLVLLLCLPGQTDCGRGASLPGTPVAPLTPLPTGTPDNEFNLDPTRTPTPTVGP